jgi:hypothetical protein
MALIRMHHCVFLLSAAVAAAAEAGEIDAKGAATDEFELDLGILSFDQVGAAIERDRMYMAARPGFRHKHLPFTIDGAGVAYSGGFYLFDTHQQAQDFGTWAGNEFALDGVLILERPYFHDPAAHVWKVIGAHEFAPMRESQLVVRAERWQTPAESREQFLTAIWPLVRLTAQKRGYTAVWVLYNEGQRLASVISFDDRAGPWDRSGPDFASRDALADDETMGKVLDSLGWPKLFDRTSWVLTQWFPYAAGDTGEAASWPHSPPFPEPYPGDGVCVPSRGETAATAPADCPLLCGDTVAQEDETTANCPSDVRLE